MRAVESEPTGYAPQALEAWADRVGTWAAGGEPNDLPRVGSGSAGQGKPRACFVYFISGAKARNPVAATAFIGRLKARPVR